MATDIVMPTVRTPAEIDALKFNWASDPCWDIEDTEGFEAHHDELLAWCMAYEEKIEAEYQDKLQVKARLLGVPGNVMLAAAVLHLEQRVRDFERRVSELEGK